MYELVLSFEKNDIEMIEALNKEFGDSVRYEENKGFNGLEVFLTAIIPITALSLQVLDFLLTHLHKENKKRILITSDGEISIEGYSEEEARQIIIEYWNHLKYDKS